MLRRKQDDELADGPPPPDGQVDRVTGLPGRAQLQPWLQECLQRGRSTSERTELLMIDIGHLRDVNDACGPDVGDELLRGVARRLNEEIGGGQRLLRYAGAEFASSRQASRRPRRRPAWPKGSSSSCPNRSRSRATASPSRVRSGRR